MYLYLVTYDRRAPGKSHGNPIERLQSFRWCQPLGSTWLIDTQLSASEVAEGASSRMEPSDGLLVIDLTHRPRYLAYNLNREARGWLKEVWP